MLVFTLCLPTRGSSSIKDEAFFAFLACALNLQNRQQGLHGKPNGVPLRSTGNRHKWHGAQLCFLHAPYSSLYYKPYIA